jgi:hypothetical protein
LIFFFISVSELLLLTSLLLFVSLESLLLLDSLMFLVLLCFWRPFNNRRSMQLLLVSVAGFHIFSGVPAIAGVLAMTGIPVVNFSLLLVTYLILPES